MNYQNYKLMGKCQIIPAANRKACVCSIGEQASFKSNINPITVYDLISNYFINSFPIENACPSASPIE